jgi:hypothetical protein
MMSETLHDVVNRENIHGYRRLLSEHQLFLGELRKLITIRLYENPEEKRIEFDQSHFIHTPKQAGPYRPSTPWASNETRALSDALSTLTVDYRSAVQMNERPDDSWLVENEHFTR